MYSEPEHLLPLLMPVQRTEVKFWPSALFDGKEEKS